MFLRDLTELATQREFVYSHAWRPYDLVMWDNRTTMHRARRFDRNEVRDVRRTTLAGDAPRSSRQRNASALRDWQHRQFACDDAPAWIRSGRVARQRRRPPPN